MNYLDSNLKLLIFLLMPATVFADVKYSGQVSSGSAPPTGIWSPAANTLNFSTGGSERLRINSSGNIGIGTSSPSATLDVNGNINVLGFGGSRWKVTEVFKNKTGQLPHSGSFTSSGGDLLIWASGTGFASGSGYIIGMKVNINSALKGCAIKTASSSSSHTNFINNAIAVTGLSAGTHNLSLDRLNAQTLTDSNDRFEVTIMEVPFAVASEGTVGCGGSSGGTPPTMSSPAVASTGSNYYYSSSASGSTWSSFSPPGSSTSYSGANARVAIDGTIGGFMDSLGYMWWTGDITVSSPSFSRLSSTRINDYTMSSSGAITTLSGTLYYCATPPSCGWATRSTSTSNGINKLSIDGLKVVARDRNDFTTLLITTNINSTSSSWQTVTNSQSYSFTNIDISGTSLAGITNSGAVVYCSSAPSCSWQTVTGSISNPVRVTINGSEAAVIDSSGNVYFTDDISASSVSWYENTNVPSGLTDFAI